MSERTSYRIFGPMVLLLLVLPLFPGQAQKAQEDESIAESAEDRAFTPETVAILPWIYEKGTLGAQITAREFLRTCLTKSPFFREDSFQIIPEELVISTWTKGLDHDVGSARTELPTPRELLKLGQSLGADWVITGRARWHTRSIWIGLGPKTKSDCTVDMVIVDVKKREMSLDARNVKLASAPREDPLKAATVLLFGIAGAKGPFLSSLPLIFVSGGPRTPREQNAVQSAISTAIRPWLALHPSNRKIDAPDAK